MSKQQVVYWCHNANLESVGRMSMLSFEPQLLLADLVKKRNTGNRGYSVCSALRESFGNTYYLETPLDFDVEFIDGIAQGERADWVLHKPQSFNDRINFELDYSWLFFSEEPLIMRQSHPFFHNTEANKYGVLASGAYDIGKWFRSVGPSIILWEDQNKFKAKRGEPSMYLEFETDKKIVFKQFYPTQRILNTMRNCTQQHTILPKLSLLDRYNLFARAKLRKVILEDIKKNLLD